MLPPENKFFSFVFYVLLTLVFPLFDYIHFSLEFRPITYCLWTIHKVYIINKMHTINTKYTRVQEVVEKSKQFTFYNVKV